jgi:non-lysosomal glucosylceramidase
MTQKLNSDWPVLTSYDQDHLDRIAMPVGGIGTGTVSLGGRGDLRDWEINNRPSKGFEPSNTFFAINLKQAGSEPITRALESVIPPHYEGQMGCRTANFQLPRFRHGEFHAAYPFGQVLLSDPDLPVDVRVEAFNPLIPGDADASGIPVAVLRFVVRNLTGKPLQASVCGTLQNFIGTDGKHGDTKENVNTFKAAGGLQGLFMTSRGVAKESEFAGTMALTTPAKSGVTYRTAWDHTHWGHSLLEFWDDFDADGKLTNRKQHKDINGPRGSLAVKGSIPAKGEKTFTFLLTWVFPNRRGWPGPWGMLDESNECDCVGTCGSPPVDCIGNYYNRTYRDAWDVATKTLSALAKLEAKTVSFVKHFCDSDLPVAVKEAALYNVSTLRTQTCFRGEDGKLYAWEGCYDDCGCCCGSCTHVWNYEQATAFLFGDLSLTMREVEFIDGTRPNGHMDFRAGHFNTDYDYMNWASTDGQLGCVMKLYRDWQLSGDDAVLDRYFPVAKKCMEFCWIPKGWDPNEDGVMEGAQHHQSAVSVVVSRGVAGERGDGTLRGRRRVCRQVSQALHVRQQVDGRQPIQRGVLRAADYRPGQAIERRRCAGLLPRACGLQESQVPARIGMPGRPDGRAVHGPRVRIGVPAQEEQRPQGPQERLQVQPPGEYVRAPELPQLVRDER